MGKEVDVKKIPDRDKYHEDEEVKIEKECQGAMEETAWDEVSGVELDVEEVRKARMEEIGWFRRKGVYEKITRKEAIRRGMKVVKTRWIDIKKAMIRIGYIGAGCWRWSLRGVCS